MTHLSEICGARHYFRRLVHGERCLCGQMYWFVAKSDGWSIPLPDPFYSFLAWRAKGEAPHA